MSNNLTIIVTASPIRTHPSIDIIKATVDSFNLIKYKNGTALDSCNIILAHDGLVEADVTFKVKRRPRRNVREWARIVGYKDELYDEYLNKLKNHYEDKSNIKIIKKPEWGHLTGSVRHAFSYVETDYVLIVQHDLPFVRQFDASSIIDDMENLSYLKYVRFNKNSNVDGNGCDSFREQIKRNNNYIKTNCWSDNNHICKADYYNSLILKEAPDGVPMEAVIAWEAYKNENFEKYQTYVYGEMNEPQYIKHTDGKFSK